MTASDARRPAETRPPQLLDDGADADQDVQIRRGPRMDDEDDEGSEGEGAGGAGC